MMSAATASPFDQRRARARARAAVVLRLLLAAALWLAASPLHAAVKGEVKLGKEAGFSRLSFRFEQPIGIDVSESNGIVVLNFSEPVDIAIEYLANSAPDLIGAARRDPDGKAVRIALVRKMKLHSIAAAEHFFLDLLPENWSGVLPGAPQTVIDELARRAQEAERQLRARRGPDKSKETLSGRVKVAVQPTFTRFVFDLPQDVAVTPDQRERALTLRFDRAIQWDLADARSALPDRVSGLDSEIDGQVTRVDFKLKRGATLRSFRDGQAFVVDVDSGRDKSEPKADVLPAPETVPAITAPQSVPAEQPAVAAAEAAAASPPRPQPPSAAPPAAPSPPPAVVEAPVQQAAPPAAIAPASQPQPPPPTRARPPTPSPVKSVHVPPPGPQAPIAIGVQQTNDALTLTFSFAAPTPAAVFRHGDAVWLVFDNAAVDLGILKGEVPGVRSVVRVRDPDATVIRLRLDRPQLVSADVDGAAWIVTIADTLKRPPLPFGIARSVVGRNRANIVIPFARAARVHRLRDPDTGDRLTVVTALAPVRGLLKEQNFLELRALASAQGIAVQSLADDLEASIATETVKLSRPGGLAVSPTGPVTQPLTGTALTFDPQVWGYDRGAPFVAREAELIRTAADAPVGKRWEARLNLARFYLARDMAVEAKAVLDVALSEPHAKEDVTGSILRAISELDLRRPAAALKELAAPQIGTQQNAALWRAMALTQQAKWTAARDGFKQLETALATLPLELQRVALLEALRATVETGDSAASSHLLEELETVGIPPMLRGDADVLAGRNDETLGRKQEALTKYRAAAASGDASAAAQARLREIALRLAMNDMSRKDAIAGLETLTAIWRGDETETEALYRLARLYRQEGRFRDAFHVMRTAALARPASEFTRKIHDEAAATFQELFLGGAGDSLTPVEALGLFYDYRELTPIGRLGDDMIRKLADRLVSVDLLDQAAELLQHQVDKRLQGAARAQVAAKLATIYLMNHKPEQALAALRATRDSDVSNELRQHRLLLEARALSEIGRQPLALEIIADLDGREATRLRADVLWSAKRWREAAEEIERLYGERWHDFKPLTETERTDILRAAIGYALADEPIAQARLREKYAAKMADGPDARAFNVVSSPIGTGGPEFQDVARRVGSVDRLAAFLRDIRARYDKQETPESVQANAPAAPAETPPSAAQAAPHGTPPRPPAPPAPPQGGTPLKPDPLPTGLIGVPQVR